MSDTGHTPGPWFAKFNGHYFDIAVSEEPYSHSIAGTITNKQLGITDQGEANGFLMAASPDMLDALLEAKEALPPGPVRDKVCAAIDKAQGA